MKPKPTGWSAKYAAVFGENDVVAAYHTRPPYPKETITKLLALARGGSVLDAGCGTGELARRLAPRVGRVDAVDISPAMLEQARALPGADASNIRWLHGRVEDARLRPPYALIVCGDSVHWFDWPTAMQRFRTLLTEHGLLAIASREWLLDERVRERLGPIYARYSWNSDFAPRDPVDELVRRGLFVKLGAHVSTPQRWQPTLDEIVDCDFSMSGFARSRLSNPEAFVPRSPVRR
jgi:SAM-dependent methyltransferase